ncbi:MAG TPA: hypothetical protein VGN81_09290 [Pseudonocardiaceae bacterium]|jgi:hypothetical protein
MAEPPKPPKQAAAAGQAQSLAIQGLLNRVVEALLRTPLISQAIGNRLRPVRRNQRRGSLRRS